MLGSGIGGWLSTSVYTILVCNQPSTYVDSAFSPLQEGKMSTSLQAE